jgi:hypothetical protein
LEADRRYGISTSLSGVCAGRGGGFAVVIGGAGGWVGIVLAASVATPGGLRPTSAEAEAVLEPACGVGADSPDVGKAVPGRPPPGGTGTGASALASSGVGEVVV